jgi:hypothetical protein
MNLKAALHTILFFAVALPLVAQGGKAAAPALAAGNSPAQTAQATTQPAQPTPATPASVAQSSPAYLPDDSASFLGLGLSSALERCGTPASVGVLRGEEAWQDDVVFSYAAGYSLFWVGNKLWQIRFGKGYSGSVYGLFIGDKPEKIYSILGTPYYQGDGGLVYRLPYRSYPVRLRLVLTNGAVSDFYLYRADF